jgi:hypothetical protein
VVYEITIINSFSLFFVEPRFPRPLQTFLLKIFSFVGFYSPYKLFTMLIKKLLAGFSTTAKVGFFTYLGSGCKPCRWLVGYSLFFVELHFTYPLQAICNAHSKNYWQGFQPLPKLLFVSTSAVAASPADGW